MRWLVGVDGTRPRLATSTSSVRMKLPTSWRLTRSAADAAIVRSAARAPRAPPPDDVGQQIRRRDEAGHETTLSETEFWVPCGGRRSTGVRGHSRGDRAGTGPGGSSRCHTGVTLRASRRSTPVTRSPRRRPSARRWTSCATSSATGAIEFSELLILGAQEKLARVRAEREDVADRRARLADRIRRRDLPVDPAAADEVRRSGWARPRP